MELLAVKVCIHFGGHYIEDGVVYFSRMEEALVLNLLIEQTPGELGFV